MNSGTKWSLFSIGVVVGGAIGVIVGSKAREKHDSEAKTVDTASSEGNMKESESPGAKAMTARMVNDSLCAEKKRAQQAKLQESSELFRPTIINQYPEHSSESPAAMLFPSTDISPPPGSSPSSTSVSVSPSPLLSKLSNAPTSLHAFPAPPVSSTSPNLGKEGKRNSMSNTQLAALVAPGSYKYVLAMVGLPARGKSYLVKMILRYLRWTGIEAEIFNVGNFRRKRGMGAVPSTFFDKNNTDAQLQREKLAQDVQDDMYRWLHERTDLAVAFFDATNTTKARRAAILERVKQEPNTYLLFVESICDNPIILERNYKMKLQNQDYKNQDPELALADFKQRVIEYESVYEEVTDEEDRGRASYIKIYNVGEKVVTRRCSGYIPSQVAFHLMNVHISPRKIWLTQHAESLDQMRGLLGGDSGEMTSHGEEYALKLAQYVTKSIAELKTVRRREKANSSNTSNDDEYRGDELVVMLGTQAIHHSTVKHLMAMNPDVKFVSNSILNELRGGELDKMSHREIKEKFPEIWEERMKDKLHFRYPGAGGESYIDVIQRVKPVIVELERQRKSVLVVSHLAVQRCLYAYFSGVPIEKIPSLNLPNHKITELSIEPHGTVEKHPRLADTSERNFTRQRNISRSDRDLLEISRISMGIDIDADEPEGPAAALHKNSGYPWAAS